MVFKKIALDGSALLRKCFEPMQRETVHLPQRAFRYGNHAWLIEFASEIDETSFLKAEMIRAQLDSAPPPALREATFSYTRVLLEFEPGQCPVTSPVFLTIAPAEQTRAIKTIDVCYDGADLDRVARHCGMSRDEVIRHHSEASYCVHFLGFAPGFPYLSGLPACLHTPRLESPRAVIPAGSVAIGAGQTGIYPLPTSGGWNLIGRTNVTLFDPRAESHACTYLNAGDMLRFQSVAALT